MATDDFARTFDIWDEKHGDDPHEPLRRLRSECPIAHSEELGGYWMLTEYETCRQVLRDPVTFSSRIQMLPSKIHVEDAHKNVPLLIPISLDPPVHAPFRQVMSDLFSPHAISELEAATRSAARELLRVYFAKGGGEFVSEVATPMPAVIFLEVLGLPATHLDRFMAFRDAMMRGIVSSDPEVAQHASEVVLPETMAYFDDLIRERREMADPPDDLLSALVLRSINLDGGRLMTNEEIRNILVVFIPAGLDTVAAVLAKCFGTFADRPELLKELAADRSLIPGAVEEFLRYWSLLTATREVTRDTLLNGVALKAGEVVASFTPAAARDPKRFENPEEIDFRRTANHHLAFGAGPHRCIGSHLARMEMRVMFEELLDLDPIIRRDPDNPPVQHLGQVIGNDTLHLLVESQHA